MSVVEERYDVIVVGAGHAGCEAGLATARLGLETVVFTVKNKPSRSTLYLLTFYRRLDPQIFQRK